MEELYILKLPISIEYKDLTELIIQFIVFFITAIVLIQLLGLKKINYADIFNLTIICFMVYYLIFKYLFRIEYNNEKKEFMTLVRNGTINRRNTGRY